MNSKAIAGIGGGVAAVIIAVSIFALGSDIDLNGIEPQPITRNEKLGLVINAPTNTVTIPQLGEIYEKAASTSIGRSNVYMFWNVIEPEKSEFNFKETDVLMSLNKKHDLKVTLYFPIMNGKTLGPFPNWIGKPTLHAVNADNVARTLDAILSRYDIIDTVIISGEADQHFRHQEDLIPIYKELFNNIYDKLKEKHPDVKIGNSFSLHGVINKELDHVVTELDVGDFVAFTYFPVDVLNEIVKNPIDEAAADLEKVFEIVPNKKVVFFEVSWSTSEFVRGTEEAQLNFVITAHNFFKEHESKIEHFTWYRLHDRPEGTCEIALQEVEGSITVGGATGLGSSEHVMERLGNYICNAGLLNSDGEPKPAWNEFKKRFR